MFCWQKTMFGIILFCHHLIVVIFQCCDLVPEVEQRLVFIEYNHHFACHDIVGSFGGIVDSLTEIRSSFILWMFTFLLTHGATFSQGVCGKRSSTYFAISTYHRSFTTY